MILVPPAILLTGAGREVRCAPIGPGLWPDPRYRALVLLAVFCSLRWGELAALRRLHIDLASGTVCIQESVVELTDGSLVTGPPKSLAGRRGVSIPAALLPDILSHLEDFTAPGEDAPDLHWTQERAATTQRLQPGLARRHGGSEPDRLPLP